MAAPEHQSGVPKPGVAVDAAGGAVIDPTANVIALVIAETKRHDDLRQAAKELSDVKHAHEQIIGTLREDYQEKIQRAESGRLDSIRQVDREEVAKTAVAANNAITTLAKQTNDLATTLAKQVTDTAAAAEARNSAQYSDTNKRLSALELSSSEGKGKQTVADPMLAEMVAELKALRSVTAEARGVDPFIARGMEDLRAELKTVSAFAAGSGGKSQGISATVAAIALGLTILLGLLGIGAVVLRDPPAAPAPSVIFAPAPAGTLLPTTPPSAVPR